MKKNIIIFSTLIAFISISAFTYKKWNSTQNFDLNPQNPQNSVFFDKYLFKTLDNAIYYNVESRFKLTVSKDKLSNPTTFLDTFSKIANESSENISSTSIAKLKEDMLPFKSEDAENNSLNESQIKLLKSLDYQDNVLLKILIKKENPNTGKNVTRLLTHYLTIVPEKVAEYSLGKEAFIDFIRKNTVSETQNIKKDKIGSGRISFVVKEDGEIANLKIDNESKLKTLDDKLLKLLNNSPGKWNPARNALGEPVAQELIFFFGNQGC
ncbi:hypothetical protein EGI22_17930 [Lacihabitans sp. LS3-19]|uniref:hypothetical protein n=1 Tax=Lacihabitans sp. LS3-19 TaxID=2487335 RepID=UPI0020CCD267|nr:hypothetical protein [Lacihabitans sp. LS3-19]MCP9769788.1 hypothetical protein [Lacihabitans sp. LS3-19]